jgi:hypothetical protein
MSLDALKENMKQMHTVFNDHEKYGTWDSEVIHLKRNILRKALKFKEVKLPKSAMEWQIYANMPGADAVAEELHIAMVRVLESIDSLTVKDLKSSQFVAQFGQYTE